MAFAGGFPGKTPRTPHPKIFTKITPTKTQAEALGANIANFGDITKLGDLYSEADLAKLNELIPNYSDALTASGAAANALFGAAEPLLHGEVPQDVQDAVKRQSAYRALSGGFAGSDMSRALTLRDLGLTSLQGYQQGASLAGQGVNVLGGTQNLARNSMLPTRAFLTTPSEATALDQWKATNTYNALQLAYNNQAQPNPLHNIIMSLTEAYLGSMGGGGMGGGARIGSPGPGGSGSYEGTTGGFMGFGGTPVYRADPAPVFNYIPQYAPGNYTGIDYTNPFG